MATRRITLRDVLMHLGGKIDSLNKRIGGLEQRVDTRFAWMQAGMKNIDERLDSIEISLAPAHRRIDRQVQRHEKRIVKLETLVLK